jgi:3',5'-cyclic AMP phosphodiesterase CpdA
MFTLAHLSDPHLSPLPQPSLSQLFGKRISGYANWLRSRRFVHDAATLQALIADVKAAQTDHVAVTGDLVNISLPEEFTRARAWLEALGKPTDVTFVPGNHDAYTRDTAHEPERHWGGYMAPDGANEAAFPFVRRRGPVALIGVSTAVPTALLMASGTLGETQLQKLADVLAGFQFEPNAPFRVVMIHHPPVSDEPRHKRLTDRADFMRVIAEAGAELIIHGHDHQHMVNWLDGPDGRVPAIGVPSASACKGPADELAGYNICRIADQHPEWRLTVESRSLRGDGRIHSTTTMELNFRKPKL